MSRYTEKAERLTLPVIALRGIVAFPSIPINFELEREISKNACHAASENDMLVFLLTQKDSNVDDPTEKDLYPVGCVARIKQTLHKAGGGNIRVVAEGFCRGTLIELRRENNCLYADLMSKTVTAEIARAGRYATIAVRAIMKRTNAADANSRHGRLKRTSRYS